MDAQNQQIQSFQSSMVALSCRVKNLKYKATIESKRWIFRLMTLCSWEEEDRPHTVRDAKERIQDFSVSPKSFTDVSFITVTPRCDA